MGAVLFICAIVACGLLWDVVVCVLAILEWRAAWEGFKVCKNGTVYNVGAKRFATKAEKSRLPCLVDLVG